MNSKRKKNKNNLSLKKIKSVIPKNLNLDKLKLNPFNIIEDTKNRIGDYYENYKKEKEMQ